MAQRGVHYHTSDMAHEGETEKKNCMKNTSIVDIRHCKQNSRKIFLASFENRASEACLVVF
jgi:hypothetical protein